MIKATTEGEKNMMELTIDEAVETTCTACMTIPISHLQLEVEVPISGWAMLFDELNIKTVTDPVGRPAIVVPAARKLLATLRRRAELTAEGRDRLHKEVAARHPVNAGGVPVVEGMSPFESLVAAGGVVSPAQEFGGGRPKPRFLQDELEAGQRADDEKKRLAAERAKQRLADQAKAKLGGKP